MRSRDQGSLQALPSARSASSCRRAGRSELRGGELINGHRLLGGGGPPKARSLSGRFTLTVDRCAGDSPSTVSIACAKASTSPGGAYVAASPPTSGRELIRLATTGVPAASPWPTVSRSPPISRCSQALPCRASGQRGSRRRRGPGEGPGQTAPGGWPPSEGWLGR